MAGRARTSEGRGWMGREDVRGGGGVGGERWRCKLGTELVRGSGGTKFSQINISPFGARDKGGKSKPVGDSEMPL